MNNYVEVYATVNLKANPVHYSGINGFQGQTYIVNPAFFWHILLQADPIFLKS